MDQDISGVLFPRVVTGLGTEARSQDGDVIMMFEAREADIAKITQPRTTSTLESEKSTEPKGQPRVQEERDWVSQLAAEEPYVSDTAAFYRMIDVSNMIHIATDRGARSDLGEAGLGATISQNKS
jgi:hypothetical protein